MTRQNRTTDFGDKRDLCKRLLAGGRMFTEELEVCGICAIKLRTHQLCRRSDGKTGVKAFVDKFESATRWIDELAKLPQIQAN